MVAFSTFVSTVTTVAVLGLTAGCGGDGAGGVSRPARGEGKNELDAVRVLGSARLIHAELGAHEVPGFRVERAAVGAAGNGRPRTERAACRALADALGSEPRPAPYATVVTTFARLGKGGERAGFEGLMGMIRLSSYEGDGAGVTVRGLRDAAASCADGFRMRTGEGVPQEFSAVRVLRSDVPSGLGDEAVALRLENAAERAPSLITAVRSGRTLAMFFATSLSDPEGVEIPAGVLRAQMAKLSAPRMPAPASSSPAGVAESGEAEDAAGS
ncbi:hypothetical protein CTZ27_27755 [Streptomyces griseocarneus]|nr:hypothetical protein CTZ27_27755 [Streptomyces griseocarneus]